MTTTATFHSETIRRPHSFATSPWVAVPPANRATTQRPKSVRPPAESLSRLWLGALAEEARSVAPFQRMAGVLVGLSATLALAAAAIQNVEFVQGWSSLAAVVRAALM